MSMGIPLNEPPRPGAEPARRRVGRPRENVLSRQLIVETGLRLLDERGSEGAGMRVIAKELGVQPSALYNHVANHSDLLTGVRELISNRIPIDMFDRKPIGEALEEWARAYRAEFAAHPSTIAILAVLPITVDSECAVMYNHVMHALFDAGCPPHLALTLLVTLESLVLGAALDFGAPDDMLNPGPREDVPWFSRAYQERAKMLEQTKQRPTDAAFDLGLRSLIAGFTAEFKQH